MRPRRTNLDTDADRFWSKVDRSGECWLWTGAIDSHGYGRVMVGQEMWKAHRLAWFMVMGTMPRNGLYHVIKGDQPFSRTNPGASAYRGCVRPHHFRDGPPESAPSRWAKRAQSGFPPEFRTVTDDLMQTEQAEKDLMPLLLYRGSLTVGRAQAMFNFTLAAQAAEAERLGDAVYMSRSWPDVAHAVGLHKPISAPATVGRVWDRLLQHPSITASRPGLREYIRGAQAASDWWPIRLEPIDRYSPWTTRAWRKMPRVGRAAKEPAAPLGPMPEVWPFIQSEANADHDLVMAVDRAVPKTIPEMVRQDACQDLMLAVLSGEIKVEDLGESSARFIKDAFKMYPSKYGPLSLDAPRGETERDLYATLAEAPIILDGGFGSLADLRDRLREEEGAA